MLNLNLSMRSLHLQESGHKALGGEVKCLDVSPVLEGRTGAPFLAVGMTDASVRILSLAAEDLLENRATQVCCHAMAARAWQPSCTAVATAFDCVLCKMPASNQQGLPSPHRQLPRNAGCTSILSPLAC